MVDNQKGKKMMKRDREKRVILRIDKEDRKKEISSHWIDNDLTVCVTGTGSQTHLEHRGDCFDLDPSSATPVAPTSRPSRL